MVVPSSDPVAASDLGSAEAGGTRRLLLDEMLAERERPPLPPAPVLTVEPAPVDAAPVAGRRAARKRLAEVEALARRNLRAAEEARRVMHEERQLLEEEAFARTKAERTAATLRREIERLRSTEEQRAAQARYAATHQARSELATEIERVHDEHSRVVDELDRMRGTLFDHDSLLDEYSRRLREEQEAQARAHGEQVRAEEALRVVERNLEIATETARRRAEEELARFTKLEEAWRDACLERDRVTAELRSITTGDGELSRLRVETAAMREDMTRLLADLDVQAARADGAEDELATAREARVQAERIAIEATEARDLAYISLETTRSELAERTEALDAERTTAQARVADLGAQLASTTRTAESATERAADLESRLDAAIAARDEAVDRAETLTDQLARAQSDTEQLRIQAASIGDELAETQVALEGARQAALEEARKAAVQAASVADAGRAVLDPLPELPASVPLPFDAALASAFGQATTEAPEPVAPGAEAKPAATFRIAEPEFVRAPRAGGPVVELEAALVRELEPVEPIEAVDGVDGSEVLDVGPIAGSEPSAAPERPAESDTWRRTAMAELTALATDSDDLTPRRRR